MDFIKRLLAIFIQAAGQSMRKEEMEFLEGTQETFLDALISILPLLHAVPHTAHFFNLLPPGASGKETKCGTFAHTDSLFQYRPNPDGDADPGSRVDVGVF